MKLQCIIGLAVSLIAVGQAQAQGTWVGECSAAKPCVVFADPPLPVLGVTYTTCTISGLPITPTVRNLVPKATLPIPHNTNASIKDPTCYWGGVVLPSGTYNMQASIQSADGRSSPLSTPPFVVTAQTSLIPPGNLQVLEQ